MDNECDSVWTAVEIHPPSASPPAPRSLSVKAIGVEFEKIQHPAAVLEGAENSQQGISLLPTELLTGILLSVVTSEQRRAQHMIDVSPNHYDCSRWLAVSQVCCYWREIVLGCAEMWRCLFLGNPTMTAEMVSRSMGVPLIVVSDENPHREAVELALNQISRIQILNITIADRARVGIEELLDQQLSTAAPELRWLAIQGYGVSNWTVPAILFGGIAPNLQRLRLSGCKLALPLPFLQCQSLTHFELAPCYTDEQLTVSALLSLFEQMPHLQRLVLHSACDGFGDPAFPRTVELPHLSKIHTKGHSSRIMANLMYRLSFPHDCIIAFDCTHSSDHADFPGANEDLSALCHSIATHLSSAGTTDCRALPYRSLQLWGTYPRIRIWGTDDVDDKDVVYDAWDEPRIALLLRHTFSPGWGLCTFTKFLPLDCIVSVSLQADDTSGISVDEWKVICARLSRVRLLRVFFPGKSTLPAALTLSREERQYPLLPALEIVILQQIPLSEDETDCMLRQFLDCIQARASCGHRLRELRLRNCGVDPVRLIGLQDQGINVVAEPLPTRSNEDEYDFWEMRRASSLRV
ncbi:hypothetical protein JAAARDRAFT_615839 [Jaapia argillacea MUCL 33604]|uniref:Uncharacterized protein n=1 Tax=Jaapia argillacea MUCL 33604 TaxID=933084 RepID=A0A067PFH0_9AGAM|nr:hypothetical protein JAAARDRAFT_615839 [Jaapia argillacea MUCL 33604]